MLYALGLLAVLVDAELLEFCYLTYCYELSTCTNLFERAAHSIPAMVVYSIGEPPFVSRPSSTYMYCKEATEYDRFTQASLCMLDGLYALFDRCEYVFLIEHDLYWREKPTPKYLRKLIAPFRDTLLVALRDLSPPTGEKFSDHNAPGVYNMSSHFKTVWLKFNNWMHKQRKTYYITIDTSLASYVNDVKQPDLIQSSNTMISCNKFCNKFCDVAFEYNFVHFVKVSRGALTTTKCISRLRQEYNITVMPPIPPTSNVSRRRPPHSVTSKQRPRQPRSNVQMSLRDRIIAKNRPAIEK